MGMAQYGIFGHVVYLLVVMGGGGRWVVLVL